jgi:organic radical activating enzyme
MKSIYPDNYGMDIEWVLSNVCNYQCNYCNEDLFGGKSGQPDLDAAVRFFEYIHKEVNSSPKMLTLTVGEPTMWPKLPNFLQSLDESYYVTIATNGSRTLKYWNKIADDMNRLTHLAVSLHLEYVDIEHIIDVCKTIQDKCTITLLILADTKYWHLVEEYYNRLTESDLRVNINIKPVRDPFGMSYEYTDEQRDFISNTRYRGCKTPPPKGIPTNIIVDGEEKPFSYTREILIDNKHNFKGWNCQLGKTRLVIWHNGQVRGAMCKTANDNAYGYMYDKDIKIDIDPIKCDTDFCNCLLDIRIPKWKQDV